MCQSKSYNSCLWLVLFLQIAHILLSLLPFFIVLVVQESNISIVKLYIPGFFNYEVHIHFTSNYQYDIIIVVIKSCVKLNIVENVA